MSSIRLRRPEGKGQWQRSRPECHQYIRETRLEHRRLRRSTESTTKTNIRQFQHFPRTRRAPMCQAASTEEENKTPRVASTVEHMPVSWDWILDSRVRGGEWPSRRCYGSIARDA